MPSKAYRNFYNYNLKDIERLLENHETLKGPGKGKRALDHITRSSILLLVAAWESYVEDVVMESAQVFVSKIKDPKILPKEIKKTISNSVKNDLNEIAAFKLAGDGWKNIYLDLTTKITEQLNTPKKDPVNQIFKNYLGINEISQSWHTNSLNSIVTERGSIAHRVKSENYVVVDTVEMYIDEIKQHVNSTDKELYRHLKSCVGSTPWNNTYS